MSYFDYSALVRNTKATAEAINSFMAGIAAAFDRLPTEADFRGRTTKFGSTTFSSGAYQVTLPYAPTVYAQGMEIIFSADVANTGPAYIDINGLGTRPILDAGGNSLVGGEIYAGAFVNIVYDGASFRMLYQRVDVVSGYPILPNAASLALVEITGNGFMLTGYTTHGDGGSGFWKRSETEPAHRGKLQDAAGTWFEIDGREASPIQFGALWDWNRATRTGTDDGVAIQACADFCRATGAEMRLPQGYGYAGTTTLYLGGLRVIGRGYTPNADNPGPKSIIASDANPILSTVAFATDSTAFVSGTHWEDWCICGAGGTVAPIQLWDVPAYPYQVGIWAGRNNLFMQTLAGGEVPGFGGSGCGTIRRILVQDVGGWGFYGYKLWGKSVIDDCFFRRCGNFGAYTEGDHRAGGAIRIVSESVDFNFVNHHLFASGNSSSVLPGATSAWDGWGTGILIGADRADTDPLDRLFALGGSQKFERIFPEGYVNAIEILCSRSVLLDQITINGQYVGLLTGDNTSGSNVMFGTWRSFALKNIEIGAAGVDLGSYVNEQLGNPCLITYRAPFKFNNSLYNTGSPTGNTQDLITFEPDNSGGQTPYAMCDTNQATALETVMTPPSLHQASTAYTGWNTTAGAPLFFPQKVRLPAGGSEAYFEHLASAQLYGYSLAVASVGFNRVIYTSGSVAIAEGDVITGATSGASGAVLSVTVQAGTVAGGNAEGVIRLDGTTGGPFTDGENLQVSGGTVAVADFQCVLTVSENQTDTAIETFSDTGLSVSNGTSLTANTAGAFGEVFAPQGNYRIRVQNPGQTFNLSQTDNVPIGLPYRLSFWADIGSTVSVDSFSFGYSDGSGVVQVARPLNDNAQLSGRVFFRSMDLMAPPDGIIRVWFRNDAIINQVDVYPILTEGFHPEIGGPRLPIALPTTLGMVNLMNPSIRLQGSVVWNPAVIANGSSITQDITVTGAAEGDFFSITSSGSLLGTTITGDISANTVKAIIANSTGASVDLSNQTFYAKVETR